LGDDLIVVTTDSGNLGNGFDQDDHIDLSVGGVDRVRFEQETTDARGGLTGDDYHNVVGFDVADDVIELNVNNISLANTDFGTVDPDEDVVIFNYPNATDVDVDAGG